MITAQDVRDRLTTTPFQPFRVITSSGSSYDVYHPDVVIVARRYLYVGMFEPNQSAIPERVATVSMLHITDLQPLPSPVPA